MVGGDSIHFLGLLRDAAKKVAAAHYDGNLDLERVDFGQLRGNFVNSRGLDAKALACGQRLAG